MNRELRALLRDVADGEIGPTVAVRAKDLLSRKIKRPRKAIRTRAEDKRAKRDRHREETRTIRSERMRLSGSRCEYLIDSWGNRCHAPAQHMHHREGGSGRRRQKQSVENVRMLCLVHHKIEHGERLWVKP